MFSMKSFPGLALCLLLCAVTPSSVCGSCAISSLTLCDKTQSVVATNMTFNGTCSGPKNDNVHLKIGAKYESTFTFTPVEDAQYAYFLVDVDLPIMYNIPVHLDTPNVCKCQGLSCPLKANTTYTVHNVFTVGHYNVLEPFDADIRWALLDEPMDEVGDHRLSSFDKVIFCVTVNATIEPPEAGAPDADSEDQLPSFRVVP